VASRDVAPSRSVPRARATDRTKAPEHPEDGFLSIDSRPFATIYLDGKALGVTPLYRIRTPAGKHAVRAVCSCGKTRRFSVTVPAGEALPARVLTW
jgi:hypothetical protein